MKETLFRIQEQLVAQLTPAQREYLETVRLEETQATNAFIAGFADNEQALLALELVRDIMLLEVRATLGGLTDASLDLVVAELVKTHQTTRAQTEMMHALGTSGTTAGRAA